MEKIIYPYVRFSSEQQSGGSSYKRQMGDILKYAKDNGYKVNDSLKLRDLGLSAYTAKHIEKGSLGDFLDALDSGGVIESDGSAYLCVEQLDRLSRQSIDKASDVLKKILRANVNVITLMDQKIYTKDSLNDLMSIMYTSMLMALANEESAKKSERILKSFDKKIDDLNNGKNIQYVGMLPSWIDNQGSKKQTKFIVNTKVETVEKIFEMYIEGTSMGDIARIFNEKKIKQIARSRYKNFTNSWSSAKVNHILKNRCVLGELIIKKTGEVYKNYYPAIIDENNWDLVQSMKKTNKTKKLSGRKSINIFTGKMFCASCGQKYYFETDDKMTKKGRTLYYMLKCQGRRVLGCKSKSIRYGDFIESAPIMNYLLSDLRSNEKEDKTKINEFKNQIKEISKESEVIIENITTLENMNESGELEFSTYLRESSKLQKKLTLNETRIADFKVILAKTSNVNKLDHFDKTDPVSIAKAKRIINENFAAFFISSDSKSCVALQSNGRVLWFDIDFYALKMKQPIITEEEEFIEEASVIEEFHQFKKEIENAYKSGKMDGKFVEIIKASKMWGVQTPERLSLRYDL
jgi:DNA invertase Pin-like site-specific DNA recombinase